MSVPFIGEIRRVAFAFAPKGWAQCNGQLLAINQNQALFSLLGTMYGGNGQTTFALPDLRGRTPFGPDDTSISVGQSGGEAFHTLTVSELPTHSHTVTATGSAATTADPSNAVWAATAQPAYGDQGAVPMNAAAIATTGGSQPHENRPPYAVVNYVIALTGIFPSRA